eukprot:EG_transcript_28776
MDALCLTPPRALKRTSIESDFGTPPPKHMKFAGIGDRISAEEQHQILIDRFQKNEINVEQAVFRCTSMGEWGSSSHSFSFAAEGGGSSTHSFHRPTHFPRKK